MKATREVRSSKRSKSKSRRRATKVRRQRKPPQLESRTGAQEQSHDDSASLHRSEPELSLSNAECANDLPDDDGAIAANPEEQSFFSATVDHSATEPEPVHDDAEPLLLRPEQLQRRLWFRRQVARLMAGVGAFSVITTAIRLASGS